MDSGGNYQLSSNGHQWGGGSGQQVVTLVDDSASHATLWLVVEAEKETQPCKPGTPIKCGDYIRLTHMQTQKNLHTHHVKSALSGQQEIAGFGEKGVGDISDDWQVLCQNSIDRFWPRGNNVRFKHRETGKYLSSAKQFEFNERNCRNCPILNHLEAAGIGRVDTTSYFKADIGVFLSH
jgi:dolichyl-phosphate-mannose--protein O-mannosyl transferase